MCGRYTETAAFEELAQRFGITIAPDDAEALRPSFNVAPSQRIPIVTETDGGRALLLARWGFRPPWMRDSKLAPINARSETVMTSRMFRDALKHSRCLIPADGFYEWQARPGQKRKQPYYVRLKGGGLFAFAGLFSPEQAETNTPPTCTILTTTPNPLLAPIHNRMPVILGRGHEARWLDHRLTESDQVLDCLRPFPAEDMETYPVSALVSSPRNDGRELIGPVTPAERLGR